MRQDAILTLARQGGPVVEALKQVASNHGIEGDEAFQACLDSQENRDAIRASIAAADGDNVNATPTFFLNGEMMDNNGLEFRLPRSPRAGCSAAASTAANKGARGLHAIKRTPHRRLQILR